MSALRTVAPWLDLLPLLMLAALLFLAAATATPARAQTPEDVQAQIQQQAGPLAPCLLSIAAREDPPLAVHQPNLQGSPAAGLFQFMPATWASTSVGQQVPLAVATVAEQTAAAAELLMSGWSSAWAPTPPGCG